MKNNLFISIVRILGIVTFVVFLICAGICIALPNPFIIAVGVASGIIMLPCFLVLYIKDDDEWWREVEDIDQQKIFNDE